MRNMSQSERRFWGRVGNDENLGHARITDRREDREDRCANRTIAAIAALALGYMALAHVMGWKDPSNSYSAGVSQQNPGSD